MAESPLLDVTETAGLGASCLSFGESGLLAGHRENRERSTMQQTGQDIADREVVDMRLLALLREMARDHGRKTAADMLGVDRKTLAAALDEGTLSRRMRRALDMALQSGLDSAAVEQRDRNDSLEERLMDVEGAVEGLAKEVRRRLASIEGEVASLKRDGPQGTGADHAGAGPAPAGVDGEETGASGRGGQSPVRARVRWEHPDLVTLEPADDDEEVFGEAWSLIGEWRELKDSHPNAGRGLAWLTAHERLLTVELALLEEHGMTLPPEKQPLRGLDRSGQTSWRRSALFDTRRERKKAELLNRVTFGRFGR